MVPLPARIYRHWIGYFVIALAALSVLGLLYVGFVSLIESGTVNTVLVFWLAFIATSVVVLITVVQTIVYSWSYIELTSDGISIKNWTTLFVSRDESFEWIRVSRSVATKAGLFGQVLNYGTIGIETNGGSVQASIRTIPKPEYWQAIINEKADEATEDGTD